MSKQASSDSEESELYTRRQTLKAGGTAAAVYPASHDGSVGLWERIFGSSDDEEEHPAVRVLDAGTEYETEELELGDNLSASETSSGVRVDAAGGSGGGAFEDTDGDGVAELQDSHADFAGGDARNVSSLGADVLNNVYWAEDTGSAADLQAVIDDAVADSEFGDDAAVALRPGWIYNIDGEIHVKEGVTLYGMGARLNQQVDQNVLFLDNDAHVVGPLGIRTQAVTGYTSDALVLDTSRASDRYNAIVGAHATASGPLVLEGDNGEGTAIAFRTDGSPIANGVKIGWFTINGYQNGVLADTANGGYVNGVQLRGSIQDATTLVNQTGTESFVSQLYGQLQSNANTDYGIRNQVSGMGSLRFYGQMWDSGSYNIAAFDGERIRMYTNGYVRFSHGNAGTGTVVDGFMDETGTTGAPTVQGYHLPGDRVLNDDGIYWLAPDMSFYGPL